MSDSIDNNEKKSSEEKALITPQDLNITESEVVNRIINAPTKEDLEREFELFNITQSKKNAVRVSKLNKLMDMIEDQVVERFTRRPDQVSNKEVLEYMSVISSQIERAKNNVTTDLSYQPTIQVNQQKTEVNVNVGNGELDRASKEKVMDAISSLLKQMQNSNASENVVSDIDITEDIKEVEDSLDSVGDVLYNEENDS